MTLLLGSQPQTVALLGAVEKAAAVKSVMKGVAEELLMRLASLVARVVASRRCLWPTSPGLVVVVVVVIAVSVAQPLVEVVMVTLTYVP